MIHFKDHPHRRFNPLKEEWVLVSPHRAKRPWQGQTEELVKDSLPEYDEKCYLCPGNERAGGARNEDYKGVFVFDNDYAAIKPDTPSRNSYLSDIFKTETEQGICRVICFSPKHNLTIPEMELADVENVVQVWQDQYKQLAKDEMINYVQIFENKGAIMGCSNPHPHGQIWAQRSIPSEVERISRTQRAYYTFHHRILLVEYLKEELTNKERIILENEHFVCLVPYWAAWPYETMILPRKQRENIGKLNAEEIKAFAEIYQQITIKYDNLFKTSFPYSAGLYQSPCEDRIYDTWQMHFNFYPPLLRSATVKKFMVGYEMFAGPQRDITPEQSAETLRNLPLKHYKNK